MSLKGLDMVDPLGGKPIKASGRGIPAVARIAAPAAAQAPVDPRRRDDSASAALAGSARKLAAQPPVDQERVTRIRKAIADGSFPIYPTMIADRLLALKLEWNPDDAA